MHKFILFTVQSSFIYLENMRITINVAINLQQILLVLNNTSGGTNDVCSENLIRLSLTCFLVLEIRTKNPLNARSCHLYVHVRCQVQVY